MKKLVFMVLAAAALLCSCSGGAVKVEGGLVKGVKSEAKGVVVYKGIPYAAPPVGEFRWKAPQPVQPWEGVRVCDEFGPAAFQGGSTPGEFYWHEYYTEGDPEFSEDCLYLNIWAPKKARGKLPVAVWYHGGAFQSGWSFEKEFDGDAWASRGVILVTVEYRLGPFGFLSHPELVAEDPDIAGNYGTLDQIAALEWVRDNIPGFGGDPGNVTIFGQSAGAMAVRNLCSSPLAKGLFHKAIIQSSGFYCQYDSLLFDVRSSETAAQIGAAQMACIGAERLEQMRAASAQEIFSSIDKVRSVAAIPFIDWPCIDGAVLPKTNREAVTDGSFADVPVMIGGCKDDMVDLGLGMDIFAAERKKICDAPVYIYKFDRELPGEIRDGAFHSSELWYVFGTLGRSSRPFTAEDRALSEEMLDCWTSFAKTGSPGGDWKPWSEENPDCVKHFNIGLPRAQVDPGIAAGVDSLLAATQRFPHPDYFKVESAMVLQGGKVIYEGWFNGAGADIPHAMYSVSKTFTSVAVGLAIDEGLLCLDDKVISFFPDDLPEEVSENLAEMDIRSLLTMTCGHDTEPMISRWLGGFNFTTEIEGADRGKTWVQCFLQHPVPHKPGTHFYYNSVGSYMLSAIVTKVTGQTALDYLSTRLFDPIGIEIPQWETSPEGINCGGWGLSLKTEDMARFGQLLLQGGKWEGRQVIPESWVREMSTYKVDSAPAGTHVEDLEANGLTKENSDWVQGYGYQMWMTRHGIFRADGANGQYILVCPEKDAVIILTSSSFFYQEYLDLVWKYIWSAIREP